MAFKFVLDACFEYSFSTIKCQKPLILIPAIKTKTSHCYMTSKINTCTYFCLADPP